MSTDAYEKYFDDIVVLDHAGANNLENGILFDRYKERATHISIAPLKCMQNIFGIDEANIGNFARGIIESQLSGRRISMPQFDHMLYGNLASPGTIPVIAVSFDTGNEDSMNIAVELGTANQRWIANIEEVELMSNSVLGIQHNQNGPQSSSERIQNFWNQRGVTNGNSIIEQYSIFAHSIIPEFAQNHGVPLIYNKSKTRFSAEPVFSSSSLHPDGFYARISSPWRQAQDLINAINIEYYLRFGKPLFTELELEEMLTPPQTIQNSTQNSFRWNRESPYKSGTKQEVLKDTLLNSVFGAGSNAPLPWHLAIKYIVTEKNAPDFMADNPKIKEKVYQTISKGLKTAPPWDLFYLAVCGPEEFKVKAFQYIPVNGSRRLTDFMLNWLDMNLHLKPTYIPFKAQERPMFMMTFMDWHCTNDQGTFCLELPTALATKHDSVQDFHDQLYHALIGQIAYGNLKEITTDIKREYEPQYIILEAEDKKGPLYVGVDSLIEDINHNIRLPWARNLYDYLGELHKRITGQDAVLSSQTIIEKLSNKPISLKKVLRTCFKSIINYVFSQDVNLKPVGKNTPLNETVL